jgi:hypothetical protein
MKTNWMKLSLAAIGLASALVTPVADASANRHARICDMIPPNTQLYGINADSGISKEMFDKIIDAVEKIYGPIIKEKGGNLVVERNWDDDTVNAYAERNGDTWSVSMFGGLARHPETTPDAFAMVLCHELGHHLGGFPQYGYMSWASTEGQADYFASLKCMRTVLEKIDNWETVKRWYPAAEVPQVVKDRCARGHKDQQQFAICIRSAEGGLALARLLADLGGSPMPQFDTPDKSVVKKTVEGHPEAQCRLDTYFQGAVCPVSEKIDTSQTDPTVGTCHEGTSVPNFARFRTMGDVNTFGIRPYCWYAPKSDDDGGTRVTRRW